MSEGKEEWDRDAVRVSSLPFFLSYLGSIIKTIQFMETAFNLSHGSLDPFAHLL